MCRAGTDSPTGTGAGIRFPLKDQSVFAGCPSVFENRSRLRIQKGGVCGPPFLTPPDKDFIRCCRKNLEKLNNCRRDTNPPEVPRHPLKVVCLQFPPRRSTSMITLPSCMASHIGNTFRKIARTSEGVLYFIEGQCRGGPRTVK